MLLIMSAIYLLLIVWPKALPLALPGIVLALLARQYFNVITPVSMILVPAAALAWPMSAEVL